MKRIIASVILVIMVILTLFGVVAVDNLFIYIILFFILDTIIEIRDSSKETNDMMKKN